MQFHILVLFSGYASLISSSEKSFSSLFSMTPSLCRLREAPSHLSCNTVFPIPCCQTLALFPPTKKIEDFARDDVAEMAFSKHIRCTLREINPFPPYRHFEHSEKSSLHSALSCSFRKSFPLFRCHTYDAIPVCKKDPSASLGMTLRKWRFPNISVVRDMGYPSPIPYP